MLIFNHQYKQTLRIRGKNKIDEINNIKQTHKKHTLVHCDVNF